MNEWADNGETDEAKPTIDEDVGLDAWGEQEIITGCLSQNTVAPKKTMRGNKNGLFLKPWCTNRPPPSSS